MRSINVLLSTILFMVVFTVMVRANDTLVDEWFLEHGWTVRAYMNDETQTFSYCSIDIRYIAANAENRKLMRASAMDMGIRTDVNGKLILGFRAEEWRINPKFNYTVSFSFDKDDHPEYDIYNFVPLNNNSIIREFKFNPTWTKKFVESKTMFIWIDYNRVGKFNLTGSNKAFKRMFECVVENTGKLLKPKKPSDTFEKPREYTF